MRLLFADSDPTLTDVFQRYFSGHGYQVQTANNALRCLQVMRARVPDILVLEQDLLWGGGDGVLACIREEYRLGTVSVLLVGGGLFPPTTPDRLQPPVAIRLEKPFRLSLVAQSIREIASGQHSEVIGHSTTAPQQVPGDGPLPEHLRTQWPHAGGER